VQKHGLGCSASVDRQILAGVTPISSASLSYQFLDFLSPDSGACTPVKPRSGKPTH
jgi:hypothetical protein